MPNRFHRTELLLGSETMERIRTTPITVVGIGGVGAACVEALVRSGAENLRLIDGDCYGLTNLNRQLFATETTIGQVKVDAAKARALEINPNANIQTEHFLVNEKTNVRVFEPRPEILIDAIDMLSPKAGMLEMAVHEKIPCIISSMGAAMRFDPTLVRITDLSKTRNCRLARFIRKRLTRRGVRTGIHCVYSEELSAPATAIETPEFEPASTTVDGQERPPLGSISYMPSIFGMSAAAEAIRYLREKS